MPHAHESARPFRPLLLVWAALCLPLLLLGYGSDYDAWRVAMTAEKLWTSGIYTPSRSLGFPLYELVITPLVALGGWMLSNLLSLAAGLLIFLALRRLARAGHFRHPRLVIATLLFMPVFYKNATVTMDYLPALACLIWSYLFLQERAPDKAALLVGLSTGFRPTGLLFMLPILLHLRLTGHSWRALFRAALLCAAAALLACSPLFFAQEFGTPAPAPRSSLLQHIGLIAFHGLRFLGVVQSLLLLLLLMFTLRRRPQSHAPAGFTPFHLLNIALWAGLFLLLPDEPEYMLPALPSLLFLLDRFLEHRSFAATAAILLSYHVIQLELRPELPDALQLRPRLAAGYTVEDLSDRIFKLSSRRIATQYRPEQPTCLMFGLPWIPAVNPDWVYDAELGVYKQKEGEFCLSGRITDRGQIERLKQRGMRLVAWRLAVWDYLRTGSAAWGDDVELLEDLRTLFPERIRGKALNER